MTASDLVKGPRGILYICNGTDFQSYEKGVLRDLISSQKMGLTTYLLCPRESTIEKKAQKYGAKIFFLNPGRSPFSTKGAVAQILESFEIDLIHIYDVTRPLTQWLALRKFPLVGLILTLGESRLPPYLAPWSKAMLGRIDRFFWEDGDLNFGVEKRLGLPFRKIDNNEIPPLIIEEKETNESTTLKEYSIGTNLPDFKGALEHLDPLFFAMKSLKDSGKDVPYLYIGGGKKWEEVIIHQSILDRVSELDLVGHVECVEVDGPISLMKSVKVWVNLGEEQWEKDLTYQSLLIGTPVLITRGVHSRRTLELMGEVGESYRYQDSREIRVKLLKILSSHDEYQSSTQKNSDKITRLISDYGHRLSKAYSLSYARRSHYARRHPSTSH